MPPAAPPLHPESPPAATQHPSAGRSTGAMAERIGGVLAGTWDNPVGRVVLWILLWTMVGVFFSTQTYIALGGGPGAWSTSLRSYLPQWYLWGAFSPLIIRTDRWLGGPDRTLGSRLTMHVGLGLAWCTLYIPLRKVLEQLAEGETQWSFAGWLTLYHWNMVLYLMIVGGYIVLEYRKRALRTSQLEARLTEARLHALQAQLQPHFLFNTLNTISAFMEREPKAARRMAAHLGDLLRHSLEHADAQEVPLAEEVGMAEDYFAIQRMRFGDAVVFETHIAPDAMAALVPTLILQPLVENAVQHGMADRGAGRVVLRAAREGQRLIVTLVDDGPGPADDASPNGRGVGIRNTAERLEALYGDAHAFALRRGAQGGAEVAIAIPWRTDG